MAGFYHNEFTSVYVVIFRNDILPNIGTREVIMSQLPKGNSQNTIKIKGIISKIAIFVAVAILGWNPRSMYNFSQESQENDDEII